MNLIKSDMENHACESILPSECKGNLLFYILHRDRDEYEALEILK